MPLEYFVRLERFEGPLDLLLHLVKVHEINIFDIDIFKLTNEYLHFLRRIRFEDLALAGDFVAMGASLVAIKARGLIPSEGKIEEDPLGEPAEEETLESLQKRLIQYDAIKQAAVYLQNLPQIGVEIQTSKEWERLSQELGYIEAPMQGDPVRLIIMYEQLLCALAERKYEKLEAKTHLITLEETITRVTEYMKTVQFTMFQSLYQTLVSRYDLVVYFLAVLELSKRGFLKVYQRDPAIGPCWIYVAHAEAQSLPFFIEELTAHES